MWFYCYCHGIHMVVKVWSHHSVPHFSIILGELICVSRNPTMPTINSQFISREHFKKYRIWVLPYFVFILIWQQAMLNYIKYTYLFWYTTCRITMDNNIMTPTVRPMTIVWLILPFCSSGIECEKNFTSLFGKCVFFNQRPFNSEMISKVTNEGWCGSLCEMLLKLSRFP